MRLCDRMGTLRDIGPPPLLSADKDDTVSLNGSVSTVSTASTSGIPHTPIQEVHHSEFADIEAPAQHAIPSTRSWTIKPQKE